MARFIADQNQLVFIYESGTYANLSGAAQWVGQVQEHTIDESVNVINIRHLGAGDRNVDAFSDGPLDFTGTFTYFPQDWKFLMFALGSNVDAGSPSPFTHTISEVNSASGNAFTSGANNPFISFSLEDSQKGAITGENFVRTVEGAMVDTMTITMAQGEIVSNEISYVAENVAFSSGAPLAITPVTTRPFLWSDSQLEIPSGTPLTNITEATLTISNNIEPPHYLNGSREVGVPVPLNRDYEFSVTLSASSEETKELYDAKFRGGSEFNAMLIVNDAGAGTGSRDMFLIMSGCKMIDMESPTLNEGMNEQVLTFAPKTVSVVVNDTIEEYNAF